jgi:hypothetical protein
LDSVGVGWVDKFYRLQNAGPGVDPDEVDKLQDPVEKNYRAAVERLAGGVGGPPPFL